MRRARQLSAALVASLAVLVGACSGGDGDEAATTTTATTSTTATTAPSTTTPAEAGGWERVDAPSSCRCSDGSPYHFFVDRADPAKVLVFLEGGGACFSAETCGPASRTYTQSLAGDGPAETGIFADDERNPFAGWSKVFLPYCTGDLHLGDRVQDYGDGVVVHHNGAVNARAALDAMATTFPGAEEVVVAGSSAGSAAAPLYGGLTRDLLPDARITVVADASGAYPGDEVITSGIGALWGAFERLPDWPSSAGEPDTAWSLPGLFVRAHRHAPDITMATVNHAYDDVQARFTALIGGTGDLRERILGNDEWIESQGVELHSWLSPGTEHTILGRSDLYTREVAGVAFRDWLADLVAGEHVPDVRCTDCR